MNTYASCLNLSRAQLNEVGSREAGGSQIKNSLALQRKP
jgi:hypothetical protein